MLDVLGAWLTRFIVIVIVRCGKNGLYTLALILEDSPRAREQENLFYI